jgi:chorismate-pyruvate lyase
MAMRSRLESALSETGRTVTSFLEELVGERVDAHERRHVRVAASTRNLFGVEKGHLLVQRSAVLQGRDSAQPFVNAETLLVPGRLPAAFYQRLETSADPIGRILATEGIDFTRSRLPGPHRTRPWGVAALPVPDDYLLARTYRVEINGLAVMVISEWFLRSLEPFLDR